MDASLEDRIKSAHLTKIERLIAEYILSNSSTVCFMTAMNIAAKLNVSDSSVIRLSRTLGYHGYPELQRALQSEIANQMISGGVRPAPGVRLPEIVKRLDNSPVIASLMNVIVNNFQATINKNSEAKFEQIADILINSRFKHVIGFRGSGSAATHLGTLLRQHINGVSVSAKADSDVIEKMLDYGPKDCVVIFCCERYSKMARTAAEMARECGSRLIVITDKVTSPVAYNADVVIVAYTENITVFHSFITLMFIVDIILTYISKKMGIQSKERFIRMDKYIAEMELF